VVSFLYVSSPEPRFSVRATFLAHLIHPCNMWPGVPAVKLPFVQLVRPLQVNMFVCLSVFLFSELFLLYFNHSNAELNPICYLLTLFAAHYILHVSRIRVKKREGKLTIYSTYCYRTLYFYRSHQSSARYT
jgi:hypothetical protein